ncbi:MAG: MscS family membrane protein [Glaciecola sp.]|jgi:MscS family membrane protein
MLVQIESSLSSILVFFGDNPIVQAAIAILLSVIAATLFKRVIIVGLKKLVVRFDINLGTDILDLLRAPIYYSVLFLGLPIALTTLKPSQAILYIESGALKSVGVLI